MADPKTVQDQWLDALIRHQIGLLRRAGSIRNEVNALLFATEGDIRDQLRGRLPGVEASATAAGRQLRLNRLLAALKDTREPAWKTARRVWLESMQEIVQTEPLHVAGILETILPVRLDMELPSPQQLRALVTSSPFEGRTMREWAASTARADVERIGRAVRIGVVQGQTTPEITRRVLGTGRTGAGGATSVSRHNVEAVTRTAVNHFGNQARRELFEQNADIIKYELYQATLDSRTTPICQSLDGKRFKVGEGRFPPVHMNCRSMRVPVLDDQVLGERPMKPVTERQLLKEFADSQGLGTVKTRAALPRGTKGTFDAFARKRTRQLIGTVPATTTYQQFLTRQSASFQDEVLGPTRGALFRRGGQTLDQFVDQATGRQFSLDDLAKMHARAFRAAGLDPSRFLTRAGS